MLTEKDYCDYNTCVALKELGFNEKCYGYYEPLKKCFNTTSIKHGWCNSEVDDIGVIICPTLYEAQEFLREEKDIHIEVYACAGGYIYELCKAYKPNLFSGGTTIYTPNDVDNPKLNDAGRYDDFKTCLSEGIKEIIEILKEQ